MAEIIGTTGNDILNGTGDADLILTNGGSDTTTAGDGDDIIAVISQLSPYGSIDGGNGFDTLRIDRALTPLIANSSFGVDTVSVSNLAGATINSIERIAFNSAVGEIFSASFSFGGNSGAVNQFGSGISISAELVGGAGSDVLSLRYNSNGLPGIVSLPNFTYVNWTTPLVPFGLGDRVNISVQGSGPTTIFVTAHQGVVGVSGGTGDDIAFGSQDMELFNGAGGGTDSFFGNGGADAMSVVNTYLIVNGAVQPETGNSGANKTFDGGDGFDWLVFGGRVGFLGNASNVEGIFLSPEYSNNNPAGATLVAGSQYYTVATINNSVLAGLTPNLLLAGIGAISIVVTDGLAFNGSGYTFDAASAIDVFIDGSPLANSIIGTLQGDFIDGLAGADTIDAGAGDDTVYLRADSVSLGGGSGLDNLAVTANVTASGAITGFESLTLVAGPTGPVTATFTGAQFASGFATNSVLAGVGSIIVNLAAGGTFFGTQMSVEPGSNLNMTINGGAGVEVIKAVLGVSNTINGGDDIDQIRGGNLADSINGGNGADKIMGLAGADQLIGGAGADQFRYLFADDSGVGAGSRDVILDFAAGTDKLDFRALDADPVLAGRQMLSFIGTGAFTSGGTGEARYAVSGADLLVQVDLDGNGTTDMEMLLQGAGAQTLAGTDFLF